MIFTLLYIRLIWCCWVSFSYIITTSSAAIPMFICFTIRRLPFAIGIVWLTITIMTIYISHFHIVSVIIVATSVALIALLLLFVWLVYTFIITMSVWHYIALFLTFLTPVIICLWRLFIIIAFMLWLVFIIPMVSATTSFVFFPTAFVLIIWISKWPILILVILIPTIRLTTLFKRSCISKIISNVIELLRTTILFIRTGSFWVFACTYCTIYL